MSQVTNKFFPSTIDLIVKVISCGYQLCKFTYHGVTKPNKQQSMTITIKYFNYLEQSKGKTIITYFVYIKIRLQ